MMQHKISLSRIAIKPIEFYRRAIFLAVCCLGLVFSSLGQGVADGVANFVDLFTGDFSYKVPLVNIQGPNGESFPLELNYRSGIRVEQDASWIGLGWEMSVGSITRNTNGIPDDWRGVQYSNKSKDDVLITQTNTRGYGPVYFKDFPSSTDTNGGVYDNLVGNLQTNFEDFMDVYQSSRQMINKSAAFEFPDYDQFYVSGPGIGGEMGLHLFDFATLRHKDFDTYRYCDEGTLSHEYMPFTKTPQFKFKRKSLTQVKAPFYGNGYGENGLDTINPIHTYTQLNEGTYSGAFWGPKEVSYTAWTQRNSPGPNTGPWHNDDWGDDHDVNTNRMHEGNYIRYFLNHEIDDFDPDPGAIDHHDLRARGFLDFEDRSSPAKTRSFVGDDHQIGAIQVTNVHGVTYHYSLPAYRWSEVSTSFRLSNDYSFDNSTSRYNIHKKPFPFAYEWKLTAITGPDYIDHNKNGRADVGDKGYWISLEYTLWDDSHDFRSPYFGYFTDLQTRIQHFENKMNNWDTDLHGPIGSYVSGKKSIVYLDKITTATQTAYFVKSVRVDGHGTGGEPLLRLEKIVLLDNEDLSVFPENESIETEGWLSLPSVSGALKTINISQYESNEAAIKSRALRIIEFNQDYSLCPNLFNNANSQYSTNLLSVIGEPEISFEIASSFNSQSNSGRLTLNKVSFLETGGKKVIPDYDFDYNSGDPTNNPNYDPWRTSYFGFYKATNATQSVRSGYITSSDKDYVDAWCLREIETPLGGKIKVNYEADDYERVGYDSWNGNPVPPVRTFRIRSATLTGSYGLTNPLMKFYDPDAVALFSDSAVTSSYLFFPYGCTNPPCSDVLISNDMAGLGVGNDQLAFSGLTAPIACNSCNSNFLYNKNGEVGFGYLRLKLSKAYGGGVRVASLMVQEPERSESYTLDFEYSKGIATTEPDRFMPDASNTNVLIKSKHGADRHALSPSVGYTNVSIKSSNPGSAGMGRTDYEFVNYADPFYPNTVQAAPSFYNLPNSIYYFKLFEVNKIIDGNGYYGKLRGMKQFDESGDMIASVENVYESIRENMGRIEEIFHRAHEMDPNVFRSRGDVIEVHNVFYKVILNGYLKKSTASKDGVTSVVEYLDHDIYSGLPGRILTHETSSGETSVVTKYLYSNGSYGVLGPKCLDEDNTNQLSLVEEGRMFRNSDLIGGQYLGYANNFDIRSFQTGSLSNAATSLPVYLESANRIYNGSSSSSSWLDVKSITLLDTNYKVLETKGIGDADFSSTKYGYESRYPIATASGANYASFTWSGFEDISIHNYNSSSYVFADGEVLLPQAGYRSPEDATSSPHSGFYQVKLPASTTGSNNCPLFTTQENTINNVNTGLLTDRTYRISVWMHESNPSEAKLVVHLTGNNGATNTLLSKQIADADEVSGSWHQVNIDLKVPHGYNSDQGDLKIYLENGSSTTMAYFDDLMFHPVDAVVSATVMDKKTGRNLYRINSSNFYTRYEYDAAGRIVKTYIETEAGEKQVSETRYGYAKGL